MHMNGRVYDPMIGRFMSVDPVYQAPTNSQSVNPYSYVMNNPLSLVDPSGYASADLGIADPKTGGQSPQGQIDDNSPVLIDTGMGGTLGGEGGRDSKGNLIQNVDISSLQAGEGVRLANGTSIIMNGDGTVDAFDGNGAVLGTGIALPRGDGDSGNQGGATTKETGQTQSQTTGSTPKTTTSTAATSSTATPEKPVALDKQKFAQQLDDQTPKGTKSGGKCATYVRKAMEAGGLDTSGHPVDAGNYGPLLTKLGAVRVAGTGDLSGYKHQIGDIAVFDINDTHQSGHIAGYDGHQWVSDWKQGTFIPYKDQSHVPPYTIYRFPDPPAN